MAKSAGKGIDPTAPVIVLGMGRFGSAVARSLVQLGHEVLAVDERADIVQKLAGDFTHVVAADTTDTEALRQIGAEQFSVAVVGIGTDIEASVLTVLGLLDLGVSEVWAKAISGKHAAILERVGATHVIRPESQMGKRVAHLVTGAMKDYVEFEDGYAIARTGVPSRVAGMALKDMHLRSKYGIIVVGVRRDGEIGAPMLGTVIEATDELLISGPVRAVEQFSKVARD